MAIWSKSLLTTEPLTEAIFNYYDIKCHSEFCWLPRLDKWEGYLKTEFKYLHLNVTIEFCRNYIGSYDGFVKEIERIRNEIKHSFDSYFNELWC